MKEELCLLVTESLLWFPQYFEDTPVNENSSIVPFIPDGKENMFQYVQLETAQRGLIHCGYSELRLKCCLIAPGFF